MTSRRAASIRFEYYISNAGVPPQGNQCPPQEHAREGDRAPTNPPAITDGEIRLSFIKFAQGMTT